MKPSTRRRFISIRFDFPTAELEQQIISNESSADGDLVKRIVSLGRALRTLKDHDLEEAASTRLLIYAARLIHSGFDPVEACRCSLVEPLTDDLETADALMEIVRATFGR
jgi:nitric oxide reductase NorQ protein